MRVKQLILVALVVLLTAFASFGGGWKWEHPGNDDNPGKGDNPPGHVDH